MIALALATALFWVSALFLGWREISRIPSLRDQPSTLSGNAPGGWPSLRVVCAARDEETDIEAAVRSWLASDYPALKVVAVDDRSTDRTGEILDRLSAQEDRLRVLHVAFLPRGWLGKNHALFLGARDSPEEWLLFTDGDVRFHPLALKKAVGFAQAQGLDHLACGPGIPIQNWVLMGVISFFSLLFGLAVRPTRAALPRSSAHVGIGAFNLVRRQAYESVGGHQPVRLRPDDDLKLGKIIKKGGFRQMFAGARGMVEVRWYRTVGQMARGLEKNLFAGLEYSPLRAALCGVGFLWLFYGPFVGLLVARGVAQLLFAAAVASLLLLSVVNGRVITGASQSASLALPLSSTIFLYIFLRAVYLTYRRGGILWRDRFYPLSELRQNRI